MVVIVKSEWSLLSALLLVGSNQIRALDLSSSCLSATNPGCCY